MSTSSSSEDEEEKSTNTKNVDPEETKTQPIAPAPCKPVEPPPGPVAPPPITVEASPSSKWKPLQPAAETATPPRIVAPPATSNRKRKESSPDLEEKENSCVVSSPCRQNPNPVLSPLTLSGNKESCGFLSPKRARQEACSSGLFSPPKERSSDILDLYDLAHSVVTGQDDDEDPNGVNSTPLSFSFSAGILAAEDNKEDSAMATLNLVEKLRSTIARKSSTGPESGPSSPSLKAEEKEDEDTSPIVSPRAMGTTTNCHSVSLEEKINELHMRVAHKAEGDEPLNCFEGVHAPPPNASVLPTATLPLPSSLQKSPLRPPMPSTVAQIIESVVNNHHHQGQRMGDGSTSIGLGQNNSAQSGVATATALSILQTLTTNNSGPNMSSNNILGVMNTLPPKMSTQPSMPTKTPLSVLNKGQQGSGLPATSASTSPWDTPLKEARSPLSRDQILEQVAPSEGQNVQQPVVRAARGSRDSAPGKRGASPRIAAARASEKLKTEEPEQPVVTKGRGRPKEKGNSPRGRKPGGRGKGKGKNFVGPVRKDLAGTVYDIDFDEFEENNEDKFEEFRMLRERRKSASSMDSHNLNHSPVWSNQSSVTTKTEQNSVFGSPPLSLSNSAVVNNSSLQQMAIPQKIAAGLLQPPLLPGPVDMRTYNPSVLTSRNNQGSSPSSTHRGQLNMVDMKSPMTMGDQYPTLPSDAMKDPHGADIASLLLSCNGGYGGSTTVPELEDELDNVLVALASSAPDANNPQQSNGALNAMPTSSATFHSSAATNVHVPMSPSKEMGRNQLKVKIKGPFLDANYSCAPSVSPAVPPVAQTVASAASAQMAAYMGTPTDANSSNTLRRMRKKELLRQYCAQDMNSDNLVPSTPFYHHTDNSHAFMHHNAPNLFNRSVITIPKAVASMTIIPTKEDYRMDMNGESPSGESGANFPFGTNMAPHKDTGVLGRGASPYSMGGAKKKRRNRGVSREMAALGMSKSYCSYVLKKEGGYRNYIVEKKIVETTIL